MSKQTVAQTQTATKPTFTPTVSGLLQRQCACGQHTSAGGECEECKKKRERILQRAAISPSSVHDVPPIVHDVLRSPGQPLDAASRAFMEPRFGHDVSGVRVQGSIQQARPGALTIAPPSDRFEQDAESRAERIMLSAENPLINQTPQHGGYNFSQVYIHSDANAAKSAREINALAYTVGRDIVFGEGQYAPQTASGRRLLAHELTHVVQQQHYGGLTGDVTQTLMRFAEGEELKPTNAARTVPQPPFMGAEFSIRPDDPSCAQAPRGLGKIAPEVDCPSSDEDIGFSGRHFHFCLGSDIFAVPQTPTEILKFVRKQPARSQFKVHGFASTDGNLDDNIRLSCHRALRVAREMINAGVPPDSIEIARKGITEAFPGGPELNRVAVVKVVPPPEGTPAGENLPVTNLLEKEAVVERARNRLREGTYGLGADAYISFWTCGRIKRVSGAVDRMHVRFEGEPDLAKRPGVQGGAEGLGTNVIALSNAVLAAPNQDECVAERLVDMAFHQMTRDTVAEALRHTGARFLVGLAGLDPCQGPSLADPIPDEDPLAFQAAPECAETPLPTRLQPSAGRPQGVPAKFNADPVWEASSAPIRWQLDETSNRALIIALGLPIVARATVQGRGAPAVLAQYEIGYLQTVTLDRTVVRYVSGHRFELRVPTPIRDRDRRPSTAPWFASELVAAPDAAGDASTLMFKTIATEVPFVYEDVEQGDTRQPGNVIDTVKRRIHFITWLVARRRGVPADRFATHFLAGREFDFTQNVDVLGTEGKGTFDTASMDADPDSAAVMQFGGPTPEDLGPADLTIVTNPPPREQAGRVTPFEYRGMIREIIEGLDPPRLGLKHSPLTVKIILDASTGRITLPDPAKNFLPVFITSPNVPPKPRQELADEILIRARKRDFLGRPDKPAIVKRDPRDQTTSRFEKVEIDLAPEPDIRLIDRPGVKPAMREIWRRTEQDEAKGDPRGHSLTIYIDRSGSLRPLIPGIQRGKPPVLIPQPDGSFLRIFAETCGGTSPDPDNDTPLGAIHSHPNPPTPPSGKDHETARDSKDLCGIQFFIITDDIIMSYDATSDTTIGKRKGILGP